ncbi:hypothetical protein MRX96_056225 [Rhipicephalus microplus]
MTLSVFASILASADLLDDVSVVSERTFFSVTARMLLRSRVTICRSVVVIVRLVIRGKKGAVRGVDVNGANNRRQGLPQWMDLQGRKEGVGSQEAHRLYESPGRVKPNISSRVDSKKGVHRRQNVFIRCQYHAVVVQ